MSLEVRMVALEGLVRRLLTRVGEGSGVTSVFGRTGAVVAAANDYSEDLISFTDITDNNASTTKHGYLPKLSNDSTEFLDGTGAFSTPAGGMAIVDDVAVAGSVAASLTSNTISGSYKVLLIFARLGTDDGTPRYCKMRFNGDSGNNYDSVQNENVSSWTAGAGESGGRIGYVDNGSPLGGFSIHVMKPDAGTAAECTAIGGSGLNASVSVFSWNNTADNITSVTVYPDAGNLPVGSRMIILGV